ncbi:septum site-determining protein Ssd [Gordonia sp. CPCC 205515]|uniref:septum site-determining protein Ssd n=1 Tax=Gordonia sp. CPCC 205515 TaxID=3140791 RepID=UPI003AF3F881
MTEELLVLVRPELRDPIARCAAAAGYRMVVSDVAGSRRAWLRTAAVIVDPAAVADLAVVRPPRRDRVVLVSSGDPGPDTWRSALNLGADNVFELPADESALVGALSAMRAPRRGPGNAIALIGGHGGAGATTLAAAVALCAVDDGRRVLLLDVDDLGAGIDLTLGVEAQPGLRWQDLAVHGGGTVRGQSLHDALPKAADRLSILAPRREATAMIAVDAVIATLDAGRADGDMIVVDLPRADSPVVRAVVDSVDLVTVVTSATVAGVASSRVVVGRLCGSDVAAEVVVRGPAPGGLRGVEVAAAIGLPLLATYRSDPGLPGRLEAGRLRIAPRRQLGRAARTVCRRVGAAQRAVA